MGQVTSTDGYKGPVSVSQGLTLSKIVIRPAKQDHKRVIRVEPDTKLLILPKTKPLATFTQNEAPDEHPFLLNCASSDTITVSLKVNPELISQFEDIETNSFTVYNDILIRAYDENFVTVRHSSLASKLVVNNGKEKSTMDPSVIQISKDKDLFKISVPLNTIPSEGKTYITLTGGSEEIFKGLLFIQRDEDYIDKSLADATYTDAQYSFVKDSPGFRKGISQLEEGCQSLRSLLKTSIKKSQVLDEAIRHLALARSGLSRTLSELSTHANDIENPLMFDMINEMIAVLTEKSTADIQESNVLTRNVITPMVLIMNSDIKLLSNKRMLFNEQSKEFYSMIESKAPPSDSDLLKSKVGFELNRFDYYQYLNEFRNGQSIRNLLYNFALYLENHNKKLYSPCSSLTSSKAHFYYKNFSKYKGSQQRMRNAIATTTNVDDLPSLNPSPLPANLPTSAQSMKSMKSPESSVDSSFISTDNVSKVSKSGVLMTLGGQNKSGWHKQLVKVNGNLLSEYVDWREGHMTLRGNPVDLTFACIKIVDTLRDRKYCIEVITPSNVKRLFQAESEIERQSWVQMFTSSASVKANDNQYNRGSLSAGKTNNSGSGKRTSALRFDLAPYDDITGENFDEPVNIVRGVDASNQLCCDCRSSKNVEWISLNLLIVVCIDCSGVHRSLGSHISKIRSLTLDTKAFKSKEAHMLLYHVSNKFTNSYLEGSLQMEEKITSTASDQQRAAFITSKYVKKKFLMEEESFNANESLIKGVHSANVPLVLKALAYGGNVKMVVIKDVQGEKKEISLFEYSLTHCHGEPGEPVFDVSHLLQLNSAPVGDKVEPILTLNAEQKKFWLSKIIPPSSPSIAVAVQSTSSKTHVALNTPTPTETTNKKLPLVTEETELPSTSSSEKKTGITRSRSMLLRRSSTLKSTPNFDKHKSVDVSSSSPSPNTKSKANRVSRFKLLSFKS